MQLEAVDVVILAGGFGTRIQPVLGDTPKLLAPIAGRPFIEYMFDWLKGYGARRVTLSLGHRAEAIKGHVAQRPKDRLEIRSVTESEPLGTGGAVRFALAGLDADTVMVMNGDSYVHADLGAFHADFSASGADVGLVLTEVEDIRRFGSVILNQDNSIEAFMEKDPGRSGRGLINAGIYMFRRAFLEGFPDQKTFSMEADVLANLEPSQRRGFAGRYPFIDFGIPESYEEAQHFFTRPDLFGS